MLDMSTCHKKRSPVLKVTMTNQYEQQLHHCKKAGMLEICDSVLLNNLQRVDMDHAEFSQIVNTVLPTESDVTMAKRSIILKNRQAAEEERSVALLNKELWSKDPDLNLEKHITPRNTSNSMWMNKVTAISTNSADFVVKLNQIVQDKVMNNAQCQRVFFTEGSVDEVLSSFYPCDIEAVLNTGAPFTLQSAEVGYQCRLMSCIGLLFNYAPAFRMAHRIVREKLDGPLAQWLSRNELPQQYIWLVRNRIGMLIMYKVLKAKRSVCVEYDQQLKMLKGCEIVAVWQPFLGLLRW